jgi:DNA (cytosine-5)-methyltransferase 1
VSKFATLFSGVGGADLGLTRAGFEPAYAVEWNQGAIDILKANHNIPIVIHEDVRNINYSSLPSVDLLWASPVCCSYSGANHQRGETPDDMRSAYAIIAAANYAKSVIIENVPAYKDSSAYRAIKENLELQGKVFRQELTLNASDFGNPSSRNRFYAVVSEQYVPSIAHDISAISPVSRPRIVEKTQRNWFVALINCVSRWERSKLTKVQDRRLAKEGWARWCYPHEPFAIERCGYYQQPKIVNASETFPCLKSHPGHDGKNSKPGYGKIGSYRRQYDFVHEGQSYSLTPELMGVLMGFPIDYDWGFNRAQAVAGIGNAVVPYLAEIVANLVKKQV